MKKVINLGIRIMIACIYLYGGWLFFKINYTDHQKLEKLKTEGIATEAVVTNVVQSITGPRPEVAFTSPDRQETRFTGFCNHEVQAGQKVAVVYHPKNYRKPPCKPTLKATLVHLPTLYLAVQFFVPSV